MKIKLNRKKIRIKPFSNLTVKEYIKFWDSYNAEIEKHKDIKVIRLVMIYLSIITRVDFSNILEDNISDIDILRIYSYIGNPVWISDIERTFSFHYKETGLILHQYQKWQAVGTRLMMQEFKSQNVIELTTYLLAIAIQNDFDSEKTNEVYKKLLNYNAIDVLSFAYFFFQKVLNGFTPVNRFLKMRDIIQTMNIRRLFNKLREKD